jgi:hypothetical protein
MKIAKAVSIKSLAVSTALWIEGRGRVFFLLLAVVAWSGRRTAILPRH